MADDSDRTASLMTPAKLAQLQVRPKPVASPAAWLDQLATDAGSGHVRRLVDLRRQLEAQVRERGGRAEVQAALGALAGKVRQLDFDLLQPKGWLARATGKGKEAGAGFVAQADAVGRAGEDLQDDVRALRKRQQAQGGAGEKSLVEFEVEVQSIAKVMDQGARWLQDMRNQLKVREAQGGDEAARKAMAEDAARCELLVERLKLLRAASSAAQQAVQHCRTDAERFAALVQRLEELLEGRWKRWRQAIAPVRAAAQASGAATEGVDEARKAGDKLRSALEQAVQDCEQMQAQERGLADELAALQEPLQAAA